MRQGKAGARPAPQAPILIGSSPPSPFVEPLPPLTPGALAGDRGTALTPFLRPKPNDAPTMLYSK